MNQDELEKLVQSPQTNGNGYRSSLSVEAAEVLERIRQIRPELYEHVLAEAKRQEEPSTAIVKTQTEIDISTAQQNLENKITMQDNEQTVFYVGSVRGLSGIMALTKNTPQLVKKRKWKIFPPGITTVEVQKLKMLWRVYADLHNYNNSPSPSILIENGEIKSDYRKGLMKQVQQVGRLLHPSLLSAVFDPIDQKILEIYHSYKS